MIKSLARWWRTPKVQTPCPYCPNPDRYDNGNAMGSHPGNCQYNRKAAESWGVIGADAPCVCDHWWVSKFGETLP